MLKYVNMIRVSDKARMPNKKYRGDAGWDLFISRDAIILPGETVDIHTDIHIDIPPFIFARIVGRSSTLRKHNLIVNEGIIDNGYTGELFICVRNMSNDKPFEVKTGMRLAQILFHRIEDIRWAEVELRDFKTKERGAAGFGSTGLYGLEGDESG